jgi:prefoldin subunit 5
LENDNGAIKITSVGGTDMSAVHYDQDATGTVDKTHITLEGDGGTMISNVKDGNVSSDSTDAVNGSQLYATNQSVGQNTTNITNLANMVGTTNDGTIVKANNTVGENINALDEHMTGLQQNLNGLSGTVKKLDNRINKVGAGAAALAALHPLDFDSDDKWDFATGYGNYRNANAAAVGAFYRPNEDTMFSIGGSFGNGENMFNAGVSLKLGQGNGVSTSKTELAREVRDLKAQNEQIAEQNKQLMEEMAAIQKKLTALEQK